MILRTRLAGWSVNSSPAAKEGFSGDAAPAAADAAGAGAAGEAVEGAVTCGGGALGSRERRLPSAARRTGKLMRGTCARVDASPAKLRTPDASHETALLQGAAVAEPSALQALRRERPLNMRLDARYAWTRLLTHNLHRSQTATVTRAKRYSAGEGRS